MRSCAGSVYAYRLGVLPKPFAEFGNIMGILTEAWFPFHGQRSVAYLEVGHVYMEIADYISQEEKPDSENDATARQLYGYAREMFERLIVSAEDELAHCLYRFHSYKAFPGVLDCLGEALGILEDHAVKFRDTSKPPMRSSIDTGSNNTDDSLLQMWHNLIESVAQRNGSVSVELLDCAIAAARHLAKYDRSTSVKNILRDALTLVQANPAIDPDGRRMEYIRHRLDQI